MNDLDRYAIGPLFTQILGHKPAMTFLGRGLATQQARMIQVIGRDGSFDGSLSQQEVEASRVLLPGDLFVPPCIEDVPGWSEIRPVFISDPRDLQKQIRQVSTSRETQKGAVVVQPHIDDAAHPSVHEQLEELLGRFLIGPDREYRDGASSGALPRIHLNILAITMVIYYPVLIHPPNRAAHNDAYLGVDGQPVGRMPLSLHPPNRWTA